MALIEAENIYFTHAFSETPILKGLDFSVEKGGITAIIGESGCGKTTLIMALLGLSPEFVRGELKGRISIAGENTPSEFRKHIEPVFQNPETQLFSLHVKEEILSQLEKSGMPRTERENRTREVLEEFGLAKLADRKTDTLSWGEKQKVVLAGAVAPLPEILLLDEPLSGLDPVRKLLFLKTLKEVNRKFGTTIVIVEHEIPLMSEFADHVYMLKNGRLEDGKDLLVAIEPESQECCFYPGTTENMIEARSLGYSYSRAVRAIEAIDADLKRRECVAIIGPNGAGKSTLARCMAGFMAPTLGKMRFFGLEAGRTSRKETTRRTGFAFQNPNCQLFARTVREECLYASRNFGFQISSAEKQLSKVGDALDITRLMYQSPVTLSYGEKKRVALASILIHQPEALILDEPVAGLDQWNANRVVKLLKDTHHAGAGMMFITHDMALVGNLATRVIFLRGGRKIYDGATQRFFESDWRSFYIEEPC